MALFVCTAPRGSHALAGILRTRGTFGIARRPARSRSCDWRFRSSAQRQAKHEQPSGVLTGNPVAGLWEAAPWRGQAVQERQFQCLEAAGALFPRKAPAPSSTTCDFTVGWIYTWIPQRAAESSSSCRQPASDPSTGTVSCSAATSALRFTAPLAQAWGRCGHGAAKTR